MVFWTFNLDLRKYSLQPVWALLHFFSSFVLFIADFLNLLVYNMLNINKNKNIHLIFYQFLKLEEPNKLLIGRYFYFLWYTVFVCSQIRPQTCDSPVSTSRMWGVEACPAMRWPIIFMFQNICREVIIQYERWGATLGWTLFHTCLSSFTWDRVFLPNSKPRVFTFKAYLLSFLWFLQLNYLK